MVIFINVIKTFTITLIDSFYNSFGVHLGVPLRNFLTKSKNYLNDYSTNCYNKLYTMFIHQYSPYKKRDEIL